MDTIKVEVSGNIKHEYTNPVTIEVTRGQKGSYGWTIKVSGNGSNDILAQIRDADTNLRLNFPQPEGA